ncbi:hypothetical protein ACK8P5_13090 [Paenibacillus sp. EC2-1]|uniref:hypothetical protein n=1 Tax=Paenibacillus sp. EC2-1 TaxID=3388665 RepID=UPI003BEF37D8
MKKKWFAGLGIAVLTFGIGSAVYAEANQMTFQDMLPFMKQMHPGASDQQLNEMYQNCHSNDQEGMQGRMQDREDADQNSRHMMRGYHDGSMMREYDNGTMMPMDDVHRGSNMMGGQSDSLQDS